MNSIETIVLGKPALKKDTTLLNTEIFINPNAHATEMDMPVSEIFIPATTTFTWNDPKDNLIMILLDGQLTVDDQDLAKKNDVLVAPAGKTTKLTIDAKYGVHALIMILAAPKKLAAPIITNADAKPWLPDYEEDGSIHIYLKTILTPEEIGGSVMILEYPANHVTEWHTHDFSHVAYVTDGILVNESELDADEMIYAPGSVVYSPVGQKMRHGAATNQECFCFFLTNKPFGLNFLTEDEIQAVNAKRK